MGDMGRTYDGGHAEYVLVPVNQVIPFTSSLPWSVLGAVPEMLQTAYGSLTVGVDAQSGQSLLIRGSTTSVGMTAAVLAKRMGLTVLSTTRTPAKAGALTRLGVDHVLVDTGSVADQVRDVFPEGVDAAIELVGTSTLPDTLRATKVHGTVCFTGMVGGEWTVKDFYPIDYLPQGVRLAAYGGDAGNLPAEVLQDFLDDVAAGRASVPIDRVFTLDQIHEAHTYLESGTTTGSKLVHDPSPSRPASGSSTPSATSGTGPTDWRAPSVWAARRPSGSSYLTRRTRSSPSWHEQSRMPPSSGDMPSWSAAAPTTPRANTPTSKASPTGALTGSSSSPPAQARTSRT